MPRDVGPSPPTRGSHRLDGEEADPHGSIPAHAGEPVRAVITSPTPRVHPRPRGGALGAVGLDAHALGPSPPTRGSREPRDARQGERGSIPAHAGEPRSAALTTRPTRVHPRPRGGAKLSSFVLPTITGPSPPTRGSPRRPHGRHERHGSIPAHAGEPPRAVRHRLPRRVHPRPRGGAEGERTTKGGGGGPSPPTRGSPPTAQAGDDAHGSIPAHAGEPPACR